MIDSIVEALSDTFYDHVKSREKSEYGAPPVAPLLVEMARKSDSIHDAEFSVFSQWGDDGIIQYLLEKCVISRKVFVEFGVQDYTEATTRFLTVNDNWEGLVMDDDEGNIEKIKNREIYWRHNIAARKKFVTAENINNVLRENVPPQIGLLHIDIDGNDYWVWRAIDYMRPSIVIIEYNSVFGCERPVTVPYNPNFRREEAHYSHLFFGASLPALCKLAGEKEYTFVGCNSAGNNAYFVDNNIECNVSRKEVKDGFVMSKFRESRDRNGNLSFKSGKERKREVRDLIVWNVEKNEREKF